MFKINIEKAAASYEIDFAALPEVSRNRVISYGLTQLLSDAAAPVATSASIDGRRIPLVGKDLAKANMEAAKLVEARLSDLKEGTLRRARESSIDPVEAEAKRIAIDTVRRSPVFKSWLAANKHNATDKEAVSKLAELAGPVSKQANVMAVAERNVTARNELEIEIVI